MKKTINLHQFREAFKEIRPDNFSSAGLKALFEYFKEYEEETGEEVELDVIAICCEFSEYESLEDFQQDYDPEEYETIDDVRDRTLVIPVGYDGFIIQNF